MAGLCEFCTDSVPAKKCMFKLSVGEEPANFSLNFGEVEYFKNDFKCPNFEDIWGQITESRRKFAPADAILLTAQYNLYNDPSNSDFVSEYNDIVALNLELASNPDDQNSKDKIHALYGKYVEAGRLKPSSDAISERRLLVEDFIKLFPR